MIASQQSASYTSAAPGTALLVPNGSDYTQKTQQGSFKTEPYDPVWAANLFDKYGIRQPMMEDFD